MGWNISSHQWYCWVPNSSMPDPSLPTAPDVQLCEMRLPHCLILFELGLLFVQVEISLSTHVEWKLGRPEAGKTSLASSGICPPALFRPVKNWRMDVLLHGAILELSDHTCVRILSFRLLFVGHLIILHRTWHPDSSSRWELSSANTTRLTELNHIPRVARSPWGQWGCYVMFHIHDSALCYGRKVSKADGNGFKSGIHPL